MGRLCIRRLHGLKISRSGGSVACQAKTRAAEGHRCSLFIHDSRIISVCHDVYIELASIESESPSPASLFFSNLSNLLLAIWPRLRPIAWLGPSTTSADLPSARADDWRLSCTASFCFVTLRWKTMVRPPPAVRACMYRSACPRTLVKRTVFAEEGEGLATIGHMVAGSAAGVAEHCVFFPVDTIKTRMQAPASASAIAAAWLHSARRIES